ncbi:hypothetical protein Bbelb_104410 [Branchiostoma belcheri]|nr:hypothetical protein Bbelb_104410 [Branchiostoma belcheri]
MHPARHFAETISAVSFLTDPFFPPHSSILTLHLITGISCMQMREHSSRGLQPEMMICWLRRKPSTVSLGVHFTSTPHPNKQVSAADKGSRPGLCDYIQWMVLPDYRVKVPTFQPATPDNCRQISEASQGNSFQLDIALSPDRQFKYWLRTITMDTPGLRALFSPRSDHEPGLTEKDFELARALAHSTSAERTAPAAGLGNVWNQLRDKATVVKNYTSGSAGSSKTGSPIIVVNVKEQLGKQRGPGQSTDVLDRETRWWERGVKEAIYERMYNPTLNREGGLRVDLSGTWDLALPAPRTDNT